MKKKNSILIVDDTSSNIDVLANILTVYKILVAKNGSTAIRVAKEQKPDLILLDVMMPEIDGYEVCKLMKSDSEISDIPIIFITAKNQIQDEVKGLELGAVDFIHKPISPSVVLARINTQLTLIEYQKDLVNRNVELKNTLNELKETQSRLVQKEKLASLGELIAGITHEINTPLAAINSSLESQAKSIGYVLNKHRNVTMSLTEKQADAFKKLTTSIYKPNLHLSTKEERLKRRVFEEELLSNNADVYLNHTNQLVSAGIYSYEEELEVLKNCTNINELIELFVELSSIFKAQNILSLASRKVSRIVGALRKYSRSRKDDTKSLAKISDGINNVLTIFEYKIKNSITIEKQFSDCKEIEIYEDELNQVWTNLINNSIQAIDGEGKIIIKIDDFDSFVKVSFKDNGKGISKENIKKIFEPFFTTKNKEEGTGIGLDIVKRIIEKHDGNIRVESEVNQGTEFIITLPR